MSLDIPLTKLVGVLTHMVKDEDVAQLLSKANSLLKLRNFADAEKLYSQILLVDEDNHIALHFSGVIQREGMRYDEAIVSLRRAVSLQPGNPFSCFELGNVYFESGQFDQAIICYEKAINLKNNFVDALNCLRLCLGKLERYERAENIFKSVVAIQPDYAYAWENLARLLEEQDRYSEAIHSYRCATKLEPVSFSAYLGLARLLKDEGDIFAAKSALEDLFSRSPELAASLMHVAEISQLGQSFSNEFFDLV